MVSLCCLSLLSLHQTRMLSAWFCESEPEQAVSAFFQLTPHVHPIDCLFCCRRRALAVYPVLLMYVSIGWLALVKS